MVFREAYQTSPWMFALRAGVRVMIKRLTQDEVRE
jgi:hypothetical protein